MSQAKDNLINEGKRNLKKSTQNDTKAFTYCLL